MLAFDHGYIMGSTAGLERLDLVIPPLMDHADCLMATRGALRTCIPADNRKAIALRCSADSSVLKDDMSMGVIGTDIEEALRMNASCMAVQCFIGSASEIASLHNLSYYINKGERYGIPVLGVVAVGKEMERTTRYFALATRLLAEQGAHIIKTYYCENFEQITAACPVPIVIAGGKKVPEPEALDMIRSLKSYKIIQGVRGQEPVNEQKFAEAVSRVSMLVKVAPEIFEMDLNPLLGNKENVVAVDARIRIEK